MNAFIYFFIYIFSSSYPRFFFQCPLISLSLLCDFFLVSSEECIFDSRWKEIKCKYFFSRVQLCNWTLAVHVSGIFDPLLLSGPRFTVCASFSCTGMFQCMEPGCKIIRSFLAGTYAKNMILETCYRLVSSVCLLFLLTETQDYCTAPLSHSPKMSWQMFWLRRKKEGMLFYSSSLQFQCKSSAYLISHPCIMIRSFNLMKENRPAIQN